MKRRVILTVKACIFFSLLVVFTVLLMVPAKTSAAFIPGVAMDIDGLPICVCFAKDFNCGCIIPE